MKKQTIKTWLCSAFLLTSFILTAQSTAPDEDTRPIKKCYPEGANKARETDIDKPKNVGKIDDRSCYANYKETTIKGVTWGIYNISFNSNNMDTNGLQPRIERSLDRSKKTGIGNYVRFTGTVRILETAKTKNKDSDGTYIMQSKGKHTGGGGSKDPAICLYLAKPVFGKNDKGKNVQVSFDIYREQINYRGGSGSKGRDVVFLTNIKKNVPTDIVLEVGFRADPKNPKKKIHYSDAIIGGKKFNWNIPEPEKGTESGIRYGAYRVKGGRAQIRWANTKYNKGEKDKNAPQTPAPSPSEDLVVFRNLATGQFLTDSGSSSSPVTMSDSSKGKNKLWTIVKSGKFVNIDSEGYGILRATGANFSAGAHRVVSTGKAAPATDSDKVWTSHYNETNDTYRFESGTSGRYLYQNLKGDIVNVPAEASNGRSVWEVVKSSAILSVADNISNNNLIKVYPNPSNGNFTINFGSLKSKSVAIYNALGKKVYVNNSNESKLLIQASSVLTAGVYIIEAKLEGGSTYHSRLVIE